VRTDFLYDDLNPVQEGVLPDTVSANTVAGLAVDKYLARTDAGGTRYLLADGLGSTVALTMPDGTVETEYTYEAFGTTASAGTSTANPFQYTGRETDGTGLYFYRARYYMPATSRFVSEDPISAIGRIALCAEGLRSSQRAYSPPGPTEWAHLGRRPVRVR
jgi:RHS repeat-associated protein